MATFNVTNSSDSGEGSLRGAIELANINPGTDDIFVQTDVQLNSEIEITDSVNIGTPFGATIAQAEDSRIFNIDDGNAEQKSEVSLYRLNLIGGNAELGGAIISYEDLTITDSSFYGNTAEVDGAAIYAVGVDLRIERGEFYDNQITSTKEIGDRDIYALNGQLEVVNSNLDTVDEPTTETTVDGDGETATEATALEEFVNEFATEEIVEVDSEVDSEATAIDEVIDESSSTEETVAKSSTPEMEIDSDNFVVGDDIILGESGGDVVVGSDSDETINGSDGDDDLSGNDGNDILNGNAGVDLLNGGAGDDNLNGGEDSDFLQDSSGNNMLFGDDGSDRLIGGKDIDYLSGGAGDDDLYGGEDGDTLAGETGNDTLNGAAGNDTLLGAEGNDLLRGAEDNDVIHGHVGDDYLLGSAGNDILHGDEGDDTLSGDSGDNLLLGGDGSDLFNLITEGNNVVADFELGLDRLQLSQVSYGDLNITGDANSALSYQDTQIAMVMGVNPAELTEDNFVEV